MKIVNLLKILALTYCVSAPAQAQLVNINYPNFNNTAGLTLNGDATALNNGVDPNQVIRLAEISSFSSGSVFSSAQINAAEFNTRFQFRIENGGGITDDSSEGGADGLAFIIQNVSNSLGASGAGIGYQGVTDSVAVEFDTFDNSFDPDTNHVGIGVNGNIDTPPADTVFVSERFDNNKLWTVWVDYDGANLEVRANTTGSRPTATLLTKNIDIGSTISSVDGKAFLGFSGATGAAFGNHDLVSWQYRSEFQEGGFGDIPEPSTIGLIAMMGLGGFLYLRRRGQRKTA